MSKKFLLLSALTLFALTSSGCVSEPSEAELALDANSFEAAIWASDGSQIQTVKGKLTMDGRPVKNAVIATGGKKKLVTGEGGLFELTVDKSAIIGKSVIVANADNATLDGRTLSVKQKANLLLQKKTISVYHPITIINSISDPADASFVLVEAQAKALKENEFPTAQRGGYALSGTVKTADGKPAVGAVVSTVREDGEGFSQTPPADQNGAFITKYIAEGDNETELRVTYGDTQYVLPENRYYFFPENTSVKIDITLPAEGKIIVDKPPSLVSKTAPGAYYSGVMVGLDKQNGGVVPDKNGIFQIRVKKDDWEKGITFRETWWNAFSENEVKAGDQLSWPPSGDYPNHIKAKN